MSDNMAQAWDTVRETMVFVDSVYDGKYLVRNQWTDEAYEVELRDLTGLWINTEIIDTFDEFVTHFGIADSYFMVAAITRNAEWSERITRQWADLY